MSKLTDLENLKQEIINNKVCPQLAEQATQLVFGDGNPNSELVFIGEAPGKKEDEIGKPFVGASGKFLEEMLNSVQLKRENVYITNIVKYRPPNNRDPKSSEKLAFFKYLVRQLNIIKPKLIITLGRHSMDVLLPGLKISQVHGKIRYATGQAYLPLYHPAAGLYNGSLRQTLLNDFAKIPTFLKKIK
jgi:uracil-DNA glycosylase